MHRSRVSWLLMNLSYHYQQPTVLINFNWYGGIGQATTRRPKNYFSLRYLSASMPCSCGRVVSRIQKSRLSLGENSQSDLSKHEDKRQANGPSQGRDVLYSPMGGLLYWQHSSFPQVTGRRDANAAVTFTAVCAGK